MRADIAIIDSGGSNIASLSSALERLGASSIRTADANTIRSASHVILPGVGAAADGMRKLKRAELAEVIPRLTQPVLGICLGMHLLAQHSEEDDAECLGVLPAAALRLEASPGLPVPNMGWCRVTKTAEHPLLHGIDSDSYFYFVHSYALPVDHFTVATAAHATELTAVSSSRNFVATQFHPERSAAAGARLLANFLAMR
ncbi:MAG TPA: imidazole glycerol phosphate synthase subunit HisH [Woeseiaceae bacterium]|nr:imidazole glycerol phosphate synthase subunit HisH [Woeseiaceae bacterium]